MRTHYHEEICLMVPTRGRAETKLPRFVDSALRQAAEPERLRFAFCVDPDDVGTIDYLRRSPLASDAYEIHSQQGQGPHLASMYNQLYSDTQFAGPGTLVSMVGDDMIFRTPGFDARILDAINAREGRAVVHCRDGVLDGLIFTNLFVSRQLVEATGAPFMCPEFAADMIDVVWTVAARLVGLDVYLDDVMIEHDHCSLGASGDRDATDRRLEQLRQGYRTQTHHVRANAHGAVIAQRLLDAGYGPSPSQIAEQAG